jgi:formylglycine-generating enzyme required for sulfatase activity/dienelactone hydrolase/predicted Ser/Thr protein kinase
LPDGQRCDGSQSSYPYHVGATDLPSRVSSFSFRADQERDRRVTPERSQEMQKLLAGALERPLEQRRAYLDQACADPVLRREVESLIAARETAMQTAASGPFRTPAPGTTLGPYEILSLLGAGGMGVVYRARDARLERDVAIKFLPGDSPVGDKARKRFHQEALALAKVSHQNIAAVYDVGESQGTDYLVMEYVPGQSLADRLRSGPLPLAEALSFGVQVATALQEAHERGVVHRDLKPGNLVVTPKGQIKVLDFGLAKLLAPEGDRTRTLSGTMGLVGTPLYMSPEQADAAPVDSRTDLWSLGVVLYEALAGRPPFSGSTVTVLRAITEEAPKPLRDLRPDVPPDVERIVSRALEKDRACRYQSAAEMVRDLSTVLQRLSSPVAVRARRQLSVSMRHAVPAAVLLLGLVGAGGWYYHRWTQRTWAREQAIPEIGRLQADRKALEAFLLLKQAEKYLPGDSQLAQLAAENSQAVSITSRPAGATVEIKDYLSPETAWYRLGTTPLAKITIPKGHFRWRVSKSGVGEYVAAPRTQATMPPFELDKEAAAPAGMSWVGALPFHGFIGFVGLVGPYQLPAFYLDRDEVTNRDYQKFVDAGGYEKRKYWTQPFVRDGRAMSWDDATALFRDSTDRPGPATWAGGHYPAGQDDYPVSGVSWYEACAYAAFVGKSLPAFAQWYGAAELDLNVDIVQDSNISRSTVAPVGTFRGLGPYGTYDMAGNVREWVLNDTGAGTKFILGGAWRSQTYLYGDPEALSPFDRSPENGFRCVRNTAALPSEALRPVKKFERDFSTYTPVSDDVFRAYLAMYAYDRTPLQAKVEGVVGETDDWREEKITFITGYDNERMAAYLFLPKHVRAPYQTVVFSPSARVLALSDSTRQPLGDSKFFDYIVQSGRAVLYPIFYGTYERKEKTVYVGAAQTLSYFTKRSKDLGRSLDYLETRPDIAGNETAYLGVSMGSADGVIFTTIAQRRLKTAIFLDGGYFLDQPPAGADQADFAPRLKLPVLMVNGSEDYVFSVRESQDPLFRMLGTPVADKQHKVLDTPHDVTVARPELVKIVLGWLDKYLGRVD